MASVRDVCAALDAIAPPHLALGNDPRGLLIGDPDASVTAVTVSLDVTAAVVAQAKALGANLAIAHHPLIFHPLKSLRADEPFPGPVALACAAAGIAVACAHTNWDVAPGGVNDVLAGLLGLVDIRPLKTTWRERLVKIAVFVPDAFREAVLEAMAEAGAGAIGDYERCAFWSEGVGTFRPLEGARPFLGAVGASETVAEARLEMIASESDWPRVIGAMRAAHPYEEPAFDVVPLANAGAEHGIGRIGRLPAPMPAADLRTRLEAALAFDAVRVSGPPHRWLSTIAVCGGAGAELAEDARRAGADALVTADVRHHEFAAADAAGFTLIDAGHAATENPGAASLAERLRAALPAVAIHFVDSVKV